MIEYTREKQRGRAALAGKKQLSSLCNHYDTILVSGLCAHAPDLAVFLCVLARVPALCCGFSGADLQLRGSVDCEAKDSSQVNHLKYKQKKDSLLTNGVACQTGASRLYTTRQGG